MSIEETYVIRTLKAVVPLQNQDPVTLYLKIGYQPIAGQTIDTKQVFELVQNAVQHLLKNNSNFQDVGSSIVSQLSPVCRSDSKLEVAVRVERGIEKYSSEIKRKPIRT
jgi:hypothetical protein